MSTQVTDKPDLTGFMLAHGALRNEFGRLAVVLRSFPSPERRKLFESQLALVTGELQRHHSAEDEWVWPPLLMRAPDSAETIKALEAEHKAIDPWLATAIDIEADDTERADALEKLHELICAHLDNEEREAVPLISRHIAADEWHAIGERQVKAIPRNELPNAFGMLASNGKPELVSRALSQLPLPIRLMFKAVWLPAYRRRVVKLYGGL